MSYDQMRDGAIKAWKLVGCPHAHVIIVMDDLPSTYEYRACTIDQFKEVLNKAGAPEDKIASLDTPCPTNAFFMAIVTDENCQIRMIKTAVITSKGGDC